MRVESDRRDCRDVFDYMIDFEHNVLILRILFDDSRLPVKHCDYLRDPRSLGYKIRILL